MLNKSLKDSSFPMNLSCSSFDCFNLLNIWWTVAKCTSLFPNLSTLVKKRRIKCSLSIPSYRPHIHLQMLRCEELFRRDRRSQMLSTNSCHGKLGIVFFLNWSKNKLNLFSTYYLHNSLNHNFIHLFTTRMDHGIIRIT